MIDLHYQSLCLKKAFIFAVSILLFSLFSQDSLDYDEIFAAVKGKIIWNSWKLGYKTDYAMCERDFIFSNIFYAKAQPFFSRKTERILSFRFVFAKSISTFVFIQELNKSLIINFVRLVVLWTTGTWHTGPSCSKLTTSLVNVSLKFQTVISEICQYFLLKKWVKLLQLLSIFPHKISVYLVIKS